MYRNFTLANMLWNFIKLHKISNLTFASLIPSLISVLSYELKFVSCALVSKLTLSTREQRNSCALVKQED